MVVDPKRYDFRPADGSPLIDAGKVIEGFTGEYEGRAPDVGAYESNARWVAGRRNEQEAPFPVAEYLK